MGAASCPLNSNHRNDRRGGYRERRRNEMMPANRQQNHARRHVGLILALGGLMSVAALVPGPIRLASAQTVAPTWSYTGSLDEPRYRHTATLLSDGKVLVVGGFSVGYALASAELYDPNTGKWNATGTLNGPRAGHTATKLKGGKVLIVGGFGGSVLNGAELYDPDTRTWSAPGSLNEQRFGHTATLLENGKVLVAGGSAFTYGDDGDVPAGTAELYDPESGTWSFTGNFSSEDSSTTLLQNGKVLVLTWGAGWSQLYDPDTETLSSGGYLGGNG